MAHRSHPEAHKRSQCACHQGDHCVAEAVEPVGDRRGLGLDGDSMSERQGQETERPGEQPIAIRAQGMLLMAGSG
jgi:hypothetical protein